jgi:RNA polymerase sigma factor (sigma-70 family)
VDSTSTPFDVVELYRRESKRLQGMLYAFTGGAADAEDITQEAFLQVQRAWDRIRDADAAASYLRTTAFNLARSGLRRRARALRLPTHAWQSIGGDHSGGFVDAVADSLTLREDQRAVLAALQSLPARQRACVVLRFYDGQGPEKIGEILGISTNSVKTHLQRALGSLRRELEDQR